MDTAFNLGVWLRTQQARKMIGIGGLVLVVIFVIIGAILQITNSNLVSLFSNLDAADSREIANDLTLRGIHFELRENGATILVPEDKMLALRMEMSSKGLPNKGNIVGYEVFDNQSGMAASSFVQNINMQRALEGEIARTIGTLNQIESARVHLLIPKRSLFTRDQQPTTASVMLQLRGGTMPRSRACNYRGH